jgi:hypothetical protein
VVLSEKEYLKLYIEDKKKADAMRQAFDDRESRARIVDAWHDARVLAGEATRYSPGAELT